MEKRKKPSLSTPKLSFFQFQNIFREILEIPSQRSGPNFSGQKGNDSEKRTWTRVARVVRGGRGSGVALRRYFAKVFLCSRSSLPPRSLRLRYRHRRCCCRRCRRSRRRWRKRREGEGGRRREGKEGRRCEVSFLFPSPSLPSLPPPFPPVLKTHPPMLLFQRG